MTKDEALKHRVLIMHGFDNDEIARIMRGVKSMYEKSEVIFAKTTDNSLKMKIEDVIEDLAGDHEYFKNNPPGGGANADGESGGQ